jgi:hypothetical protein
VSRWQGVAVNHRYPDLLPSYITHTFGIDVQDAFELACRPVPGRIKIVIAA